MSMEFLKVMAALYDSEINCSLSSFWDGGFTVKLGDDINGVKATSDWFSSFSAHWSPDELKESEWLERTGWQEMAKWLHEAVLEYYPDSDYAMEFNMPKCLAGEVS